MFDWLKKALPKAGLASRAGVYYTGGVVGGGVPGLRPGEIPTILRLTDPMEAIIQAALDDGGIAYRTERDNASSLDFFLPDYDVHIEVKRLHTPRVAEQMARVDNVIVAQGEKAVRLLAASIARLKDC